MVFMRDLVFLACVVTTVYGVSPSSIVASPSASENMIAVSASPTQGQGISTQTMMAMATQTGSDNTAAIPLRDSVSMSNSVNPYAMSTAAYQASVNGSQATHSPSSSAGLNETTPAPTGAGTRYGVSSFSILATFLFLGASLD